MSLFFAKAEKYKFMEILLIEVISLLDYVRKALRSDTLYFWYRSLYSCF